MAPRIMFVVAARENGQITAYDTFSFRNEALDHFTRLRKKRSMAEYARTDAELRAGVERVARAMGGDVLQLCKVEVSA
jgi:hypothetical protein